jgi:Tol biopolymer transport system component
VALNVLLAALAVALWVRRPAPPPTARQHVVLWSTRLPQPLEPGARFVANQAAIAPDGSSIVYSDSSASGQILMRKVRDAALAVPIAGTEGGVSPFFSPDGKWIGYVTVEGKLRKVPVEGGGSITLTEDATGDYKVATWLDDNSIVYADRRRWLARIPAEGSEGKKTLLAKHANEVPASVWALPGSRGLLLTRCAGNCSVGSDLFVFDLKADSARLLVKDAAGAWYSPTGHLIYTSRDGGLYAAPFDPTRMALTGGAVPVLDGVEPMRFTLSASGAVLYSLDNSQSEPSTLVWVTRDGRTTPVDSSWHGLFEYPALAPDGKALAVSVRGRTTDLWIRQATGTRQKVIAPGVANWRASWMPDGRSLTFVSVASPDTANAEYIYRAQADGGGRAELLLRHRFGLWETEVSRDGRWMVVRADEANGDGNVYARRLDGDTTLIPLLTEAPNTYQVALSPDGRWLAYCSDEWGGMYEIYVASFPDMGSKRMVSQGGGVEPRWSRNGRELFFKSGGQLMSVAVAPGAALLPGEPRPLFPLAGFRMARNRPQYDVGPDGRFVMVRESNRSASVIYADHWFAELLAKVKR